MSRQARRLSAAAALLLLLPVVALGVAVAVVNPDDYTTQVVAAVERATGRALTLGGPLRISRSLWPTVEVTDVKLANLPGGTRPDMARVERVEAQLSLPALLHRRIEVSKLTLVGPNILFERVGGQPNWVFTGEAGRQTSAAGPQVTLDIRAAHVRNGMITIRLPTRTHVVGIRALDLQHPAAGDPLDLAAVLVYSDYQPFILRASARPTGDGVADPWDTRLGFTAFDASFSAEGRVDFGGDYELQVQGRAPELEKLNALLPILHLPPLHGLTVSTHLTSNDAPGDLPVIGETRLEIGGADLRDRVPGLMLGAVEASLPRAGAEATASGTGRYADRTFTFGGVFGVPERLEGRIRTPIDLKVQVAATAAATAMAGARASGAAEGSLAVKGRLALDAGSFDGLDATVALRLPAALVTWQAALPNTRPSLPALTDVSLSGRLNVPTDLGSLRLRGATLSARELDVAGDATIALGPALALEGRLRATRLDLDAMLAASGAARPASTPGGTRITADPGGPVIPSTPLPWAMLRGKTMDLTGSIAALTFQRQVWRDVGLALQLVAEGRLQLSRLQLTPPGGGPMEMSLSADASRQEVPVSLTLHAPAVPLALLLRYAALPGGASGLVAVETRLTAKGRSLHDLAASLDGPFAATMVHSGSLSNAGLIALAGASLQALGIQVPAQGETEIRCLGVVGAFSGGVGRFRTIALDSTYLKLDGAGQVDLGAETLALKLHPMARLSGSSVSVPVVVEGPFRAVQGRLDADGLDKLGLLIDAWLGGDPPPRACPEGIAPAPAH